MTTIAELGERVAKLETAVDRMGHTLDGNGQPGLYTVTTQFIAEWKGRELQRSRTETAFFSVVGVVLAIITLWVGTLEYRHKVASAQQPNTIGQIINRPVTAENHQRNP